MDSMTKILSIRLKCELMKVPLTIWIHLTRIVMLQRWHVLMVRAAMILPSKVMKWTVHLVQASLALTESAKLLIPDLIEKNNCRDSSDELNCRFVKCTGDEFSCGNGQCLPSACRCDGSTLWNNGKDEEDCFESTQNWNWNLFKL